MQIEIVTIGNELLGGKTVDTNFSYIAKRLSEEGFCVFQHITISDDPSRIEQAVSDALTRSSVVFTTGGLGPTLDDQTKKILSKMFGKELLLNSSIKEDLIKRFGKELASLEEQSTVPMDTKILKNSVGTAPGFLFEKEGKSVFVMPGVPLEMITMFEEQLLPQLRQLCKSYQPLHVQTLHLCHLIENQLDPLLRELDILYPQVEKGIYPGYGVLSVELKTKTTSSDQAQKDLQDCVDYIAKQYGTYIFSKENKSIAQVIQEWMVSHKKTLVLAESCTGGHLAAKLVDIPGASAYFLGSIVCYHDQFKIDPLRVKKETLKTYGAVSEQVVYEMVQGALKLSGADFALAVSGIAGPSGGSLEKPIGTVWCGLGIQGKEPYIGKILAKGRGKRASVIEYTANFMLGALWRHIAYNIKPL